MPQQPAAIVGEWSGHNRFVGLSKTHQVFAVRRLELGDFALIRRVFYNGGEFHRTSGILTAPLVAGLLRAQD